MKRNLNDHALGLSGFTNLYRTLGHITLLAIKTSDLYLLPIITVGNSHLKLDRVMWGLFYPLHTYGGLFGERAGCTGMGPLAPSSLAALACSWVHDICSILQPSTQASSHGGRNKLFALPNRVKLLLEGCACKISLSYDIRTHFSDF